MNGLLLIFTLCGVPQYVVIAGDHPPVENSFKEVTKTLGPDLFTQLLKDPSYHKRVTRLEDITGMICA